MALPASENRSSTYKGRVVREIVTGDDHIPFTAAAALTQGDFVKATPYFGIVDEDTASGALGTLHVGQHFGVGSDRIGASQTFNTWGAAVYFSTSDSLFYTASATGRMLVGYVRQVASSNGDFIFEGLRFHGAVA